MDLFLRIGFPKPIVDFYLLSQDSLRTKCLAKTHKRLKERRLIGRNATKHADVRGSHLFLATYNIKTTVQQKNTKTNN